MQASLDDPAVVGAQTEVLPSASRASNCTSYLPVVVNVTVEPDVAAPQLTPWLRRHAVHVVHAARAGVGRAGGRDRSAGAAAVEPAAAADPRRGRRRAVELDGVRRAGGARHPGGRVARAVDGAELDDGGALARSPLRPSPRSRSPPTRWCRRWSTCGTGSRPGREPPVSVPPVAVIDDRRQRLPGRRAAGDGRRGRDRPVDAAWSPASSSSAAPALSTRWNRTSVWPSAVTASEAPAVIDDQVVPPLVDVRIW